MANKKRLTSIIALALVSVMTLTACGPAKTPGTTATPGTSTPGTTATPGTTTDPTVMPTTFKQSPFLDGKDLPELKDRLPEEPKLVNEYPADMLTYEIGTYGGTLRTVTSQVDWDADVYVGSQENLLNTPGMLGEEFTANLVQSYEVNSDSSEFTFKLRKGLKWSDGEPVTMEDFRFTYENILMNTTLNPVVTGWMRSGASMDGTPMVMEFVDDETFKIKFDKPYGGFLVHLSIAGWKSYPELLRPAHYLKQFHKDFKEYNEVKVKEVAAKNAIAEDDQMWINVFNKADIVFGEINRKESIGFPKLYAWVLVEAGDQVYRYERNPYYHKVDAAGNQLPYIDEIKSELVQDMEMVTMKTLAGEVDFARESAALTNMTMYKENEKNGFTTHLVNMHVTPTDIGINMTYDDATYKSVVNELKFRQALAHAIDRDEILDAVYFGHAAPSEILANEYSVDKANALLDEMGMDKKDSKGMRLAPDGKPFNFIIEVGAEAPDMVPVAELVVEMWRAVGVDVSMKRIEASLIGNKRAANELQGNIIWTHTPLWYAQDLGFFLWGRSWEIWKTKATEATLTEADGTTKKVKLQGEEPPAKVREFYDLMDSLTVVSADKVPGVVEQMRNSIKENVWYFTYLQDVKQPVITSSKLGNVTEKGFGIGLNFSMEELYFKAN